MVDTAKQLIGGFEILGPVGDAESRRNFKARTVVPGRTNLKPGTLVCLKRIQRVGVSPPGEQALRAWAGKICSLDHPNLVRVLDVFVQCTRDQQWALYLVFEWVEGQTLKELFAAHGGHLDPETARAILIQCVDGLGYAADHGVFHRHLTPDHMLITPDQRVKLIGLTFTSDTLGQRPGTWGRDKDFDYLAPEWSGTEPVQNFERPNLFSLGVCFHQALTGRLPKESLFAVSEPEDCFNSFTRQYLKRWREWPDTNMVLGPDFPEQDPDLKMIIERCLAVRGADRFQRFSDLMTDLTVEPKALPEPAPSSDATCESDSGSSWRVIPFAVNRKFMVYTAAAAVVVVIALAGIHLGVSGRSPEAGSVDVAMLRPVAEQVTETPPVSPRVPSDETEKTGVPIKKITVAFNLPALPGNESPIHVFYRSRDDESWQTIQSGMLVDPGHYEFRFARKDYEPMYQELRVPEKADEVALPVPAGKDWLAGYGLDRLEYLEAAFKHGNDAEVSRHFKSGKTLELAWSGHHRRLKVLRNQWDKKKKLKALEELNVSMQLQLAIDDIRPGQPPVQCSYRPMGSSVWKLLLAPKIEVKKGRYQVRFSRKDYRSIIKTITIQVSDKKLRYQGPSLADWKPAEPLKELIKLERALRKGDLDTLTNRLASPADENFAWDGHRRRMTKLREKWFQSVTLNN